MKIKILSNLMFNGKAYRQGQVVDFPNFKALPLVYYEKVGVKNEKVVADKPKKKKVTKKTKKDK